MIISTSASQVLGWFVLLEQRIKLKQIRNHQSHIALFLKNHVESGALQAHSCDSLNGGEQKLYQEKGDAGGRGRGGGGGGEDGVLYKCFAPTPANSVFLWWLLNTVVLHVALTYHR